MALSDHHLREALSRMPFVESTKLECTSSWASPTPPSIAISLNCWPTSSCAGFTHGTVRQPSSGRYSLTPQGIRETADFLDYDTPSDYVPAYPMSREWLTLLIRRMNAVAAVYRLA